MTNGRPELTKNYDPAEVEPRLYARSIAAGVFHEDPDPARPPFVISMPPPNITGRAHLGTASTFTPQDVLTRYHRMLGENAVWIPGQDHAAIATETVLVREIAKEGLTRESLGREKYLERAWQWRETYGGAIDESFRRLGFGPDWARERFTLDAGLSEAVIKVFVDLYNEGAIYRGTRLVNWDPQAQSTLSDAEVDDEETDTFLWHLRYRGADGGDGIVIATTRPETYLADVAVAVHPDDERYRHLIGTEVVLPLIERTIPVIADDAVLPTFGTGAVKVTPAHDAADYEIGQRHGLRMPTVIDYDGRICAAVWRLASDEPATEAERARWLRAAQRMAPYVGMDRFAARERIVTDLRAAGALIAEEPYRTKLPLSSRTQVVIEPLLSLQWFVSMRAAGGAGAGGVSRRLVALRPRTLRPHLRIRSGGDPRLERLAPGLVGASASRLVHPERRCDRRARRRTSAASGPRTARYRSATARPRHARHVVLVGALAVFDSRLAERDPRTRALVSQPSHGHQPRHHLPMGIADGHARAALSGQASRSKRSSSRRWCSTSTAARCRNRSTTRSTR